MRNNLLVPRLVGWLDLGLLITNFPASMGRIKFLSFPILSPRWGIYLHSKNIWGRGRVFLVLKLVVGRIVCMGVQVWTLTTKTLLGARGGRFFKYFSKPVTKVLFIKLRFFFPGLPIVLTLPTHSPGGGGGGSL